MIDPFDPLLFLRLAESLAARGTTNEEWRTACGRAYYAVFLILRDRLYPYPLYPTPPEAVFRETHNGPQRVSIHRAVLDELWRRDRQLARNLTLLLRRRVEADYRMRESDTAPLDWSDSARHSVRLARGIAPRLLTLPL